ncbi:hypothetical protein GF339_06180, partial [candidate division KSB3 bacterium]|nr:hypothetical protein [candidate division KSB3 bacterium]MBD3324152.1 hypothetical protein [candidate division KSB3 bacterium]
MKITDITASLIEVPLPQPVRHAWIPGAVMEKFRFTLVKMYTDEGIVGIGASHACAGTEIAASTQSLIKPFLVGQDPFATERLMQTLHSANPFGTRPWLVD